MFRSPYFQSKTWHLLGWSVFNLILIGYILRDFPIQRGLWFFLGIGLAATIVITDAIVSDEVTQFQFVSTSCLVLLLGFVLRWTMYDRIAVVTGDHWAFLSFATQTVSNGVTPQGMGTYSSAPFLILNYAINHLLTGIDLINIKLTTIVTASLLPLLVGSVLYAATYEKRFFILGIELSAPFVLFTRGAALVEGEFLVLLWFCSILLLIGRLLQRDSWRLRLLLLILLGLSPLVHPFYALVFLLIVGGIMILSEFFQGRGWSKLSTNRSLASVILAAGVVILFFVFFTSILKKAVLIGTTFDISGSVTSIVTNIFSPTGSVGRSIGANDGGGSGTGVIIKFLQVFLVMGLAGYGGLHALFKREKIHEMLLFMSIPIFSLGAFATLLSFKSNVGFRVYYFIGFAGILLASIGVVSQFDSEYDLSRVVDVSHTGARYFIIALLIVYTMIFWTLGPISILGNNVDPRLGGERAALTTQEFEELRHLDRRAPAGPYEDSRPITRNYIHKPSIGTLERSRIVNAAQCSKVYSNKVWAGGSIIACDNR